MYTIFYHIVFSSFFFVFFFFNDTATTEIYTLSLHDALPISRSMASRSGCVHTVQTRGIVSSTPRDRKSTRLNSSHRTSSYAVFCLKNKKNNVYIVRRSSPKKLKSAIKTRDMKA